MIDVALQFRGKALAPYSQEDLEALRQYRQNQVLRAKITGAKKPRSYLQLKKYWACCRTVAENLEGMDSKDVDFEVKIRIAKEHPSMIRRFKDIGGTVYMEPVSIAYHNMDHLEACHFFDLAFPIMAAMIDVETDVLLENLDF
jgi:hypothetical protein